MAEKEAEQREIYYSGRVQGVGFRYTARSLAGQYRISGFAKNMPDGRVQLVVEGAVDEVAAFIDDLQAEMGNLYPRYSGHGSACRWAIQGI
jgi:acylphosphatase